MSEMLVAAIAGGAFVAIALGRGRLFGNVRQKAELLHVSTYRQRLAAFNRELNRARRADRSLTVVALALDRESSGPPGSTSGEPRTTRLAYMLVGSMLRELIREHDLVAYDPATDRYVLMLVDSDRGEAIGLIGRIQDEILARSTLLLQAGLAQLPEDGLTLADLVRRAGERCESWNKKASVEKVDRLPVARPQAADTAGQLHNSP
jgi:hypothetical protein